MDFISLGITVLVTDLSLVATCYLVRNRILGMFGRFLTDYIDGTLAFFSENPDKLAPFLDSLTKAGMKSLGITKEQSLPGMKIGGLKVPGWAMQMLMPVLQKQARSIIAGQTEKALENALA